MSICDSLNWHYAPFDTALHSPGSSPHISLLACLDRFQIIWINDIVAQQFLPAYFFQLIKSIYGQGISQDSTVEANFRLRTFMFFWILTGLIVSCNTVAAW